MYFEMNLGSGGSNVCFCWPVFVLLNNFGGVTSNYYVLRCRTFLIYRSFLDVPTVEVTFGSNLM